MHFSRKLYVSPSIKKKKRSIVWKLRAGKTLPSIYVIVLSSNNDLLEIFHSALLKQPFYKENPPYITGIADGYQEAVSLVQDILMDTRDRNGDWDVKSFCQNI